MFENINIGRAIKRQCNLRFFTCKCIAFLTTFVKKGPVKLYTGATNHGLQ